MVGKTEKGARRKSKTKKLDFLKYCGRKRGGVVRLEKRYNVQRIEGGEYAHGKKGKGKKPKRGKKRAVGVPLKLARQDIH